MDIEEAFDILEGDPSEKNAKDALIKNIKETFGNDCIKKNYSERSFRDPNLIILKKKDINLILYFHYSGYNREIGFYGFDKNLVAEVVDYINRNSSEKIYFYLLFILKLPNDEAKYFCIPIFYIKNFGSDISTSSLQYKLHLKIINGKYKFRLKNKRYEDISNFETDIKGLFNENFMTIHNEEKIRYRNTIKARQELMKNLVRN